MRTPLLLLLAVLPALACRSNRIPDMTREQKLGVHYENALRYFNMRDLDRTEQQCLKALELDPGNERFLLMLGNVYLRRGRTEDILRALQVFEEHPNQSDYRIHLGLGEAHERLSVLEREAAVAIESGDRFTDAESPEERAAQLRASAHGHLVIAKAGFERAEGVHKGELNAVNGLIRTHALLGEDEPSIRWSRVLIDVLRNSSALRLQELQDVEILASREAELTAAIRRNSDMIVKTHLHVASVLRRLDRKQEAADELGQVVTLDPGLSAAYSRRAQLFFELGQHLKAKESVERYIELEYARSFDDPEIRAAFDLLARCQEALAGAELAAGGR